MAAKVGKKEEVLESSREEGELNDDDDTAVGGQLANEVDNFLNSSQASPGTATSSAKKFKWFRDNGECVEGSFYDAGYYTCFLDVWLENTNKKKVVHRTVLKLTKKEQEMMSFAYRDTLCYHSITVKGLPPSVFYGNGFGRAGHLATNAASYEFVCRLYDAGLITPFLFSSIATPQDGKTTSKTVVRRRRLQRRRDYDQCKANLFRLEEALSIEEIPAWFLEQMDDGYGHVQKPSEELLKKVQNIVDRCHAEFVGEGDNYVAPAGLLKRSASALELEEPPIAAKKIAIQSAEETKPKPEAAPAATAAEDSDCVIIEEVARTSGPDIVIVDDDDNNESAAACSNTKEKAGGDGEPRRLKLGNTTSVVFRRVKNGALKETVTAHAEHTVDTADEPEVVDETGGDNAPRNAVITSVVGMSVVDTYSALLGVYSVRSAMAVFDTIAKRRIRYIRGFREFDDSIWEHFKRNQQNDETFSWKMSVRSRLQDLVKKVYPRASLITVGSTVNKCGSFNSDMDLCLCLPDGVVGYDTDKKYESQVLQQLRPVLAYRSRGLVKQCDYIPAKVPILKLTMAGAFDMLEVDMNCNNIAGIYNSHLIHYYATIDDRFPALCLVVKHWAINAGINDAMTGTFNSYSLIMLVLHYLQCGVQPPVLPNLQFLFPAKFDGTCDLGNLELFKQLVLPERPLNKMTIGELLMGFFHYFSRFDFGMIAISVRLGKIFSRRELPPQTRSYRIFIEEPYDYGNTARCVTRLECARAIRRAFVGTRDALMGPQAKAPKLRNIGVEV